jgi:hypothetical protein
LINPTIENLDTTITQLIQFLLPTFTKKWSTHKCKHPNCRVALNIDGNHKVTRLTCLFNDIYQDTEEIISNKNEIYKIFF